LKRVRSPEVVEIKEYAMPEHAIRIDFDYGLSDWSQFWTFEKELEKVVDGSGLGEYDGNELALDRSIGTLFLYGPDANRLLGFVWPYLRAATFMKNAVVTLTYGPGNVEGVHKTIVRLGSAH